jgi:hypothetical protein
MDRAGTLIFCEPGISNQLESTPSCTESLRSSSIDER